MTQPTSAALPIAYGVLRLLIVINWLLGACILGLLAYTFVDEAWTMRALGVTASGDAPAVLAGMRAVAALGVAAIPLNHVVFTRLLAMVETVRAGDPFVAANAARLQVIAWTLVGLQCLSLAIAAIARAISTAEHPFKLDAGFSANGWLAIILMFVLARVFAEGSRLRDELEGTV